MFPPYPSQATTIQNKCIEHLHSCSINNNIYFKISLLWTFIICKLILHVRRSTTTALLKCTNSINYKNYKPILPTTLCAEIGLESLTNWFTTIFQNISKKSFIDSFWQNANLKVKTISLSVIYIVTLAW